MFGIVDILYLLGSLTLFLYGMKVMSDGLQKLSGEKMRSILSVMTQNRLLGVLTGVLVTALIQSSSATTLMVVSFTNAGMLSLSQSISVIMGANIGTTVTAWIISLLGFKYDISTFAIPLLAIALPLLFSKKENLGSWAEFIIGFSVLFLGLQFLKDSMPDLQANPDMLSFLQRYTDMGFASVLLFLLVGTLMTLVVQSSSATVAITLIMCVKGWIPFELGTAMILGENIGTTVTANLAALRANTAAKRTAFSHFLFNVFGVIWVLCFYFPLVSLVSSMVTTNGADPRALSSYISELSNHFSPEQISLATSNAPITGNAALASAQADIQAMGNACSIGLALFHTLFNITNTIIMVWFIPVYVKICNVVIRQSVKKERKMEFSHLQYLQTGMRSTAEFSVVQAQKEVVRYAKKVQEMLKMVSNLIETEEVNIFEENFNRLQKYENICDRIEVEIVEYLRKLSEDDLSTETRREVHKLISATTEIESMGDACYNMGQIIQRRNNSEIVFSNSILEHLHELQAIVDHIMEHTILTLEKTPKTSAMFYTAENLEHDLNNKRDLLVKNNMRAIEEKKYDYQESVYYRDLIDEYEQFGDFAINVVEAVTGYKHT